MIFVSIAAYRDPQLVPTIADCLAKAAHPEDLRFGICWQHGPEEGPLPFAADPRFQIIDVDWQESRGACWARAEIMKRFAGEEWFLQIDSHHRFAQDWDVKAMAQAARTGSARPILTAYATPFHPDRPDSFGDEPMQMNFDRFTPEGIILFRPGAIADWRHRATPVRARFLSAHFLFAPGSFVADVPYDPELYFIGEEITLAVRAFTHGYDLFHPTEILVWHEYTRDYRPHKHWGDHVKANGIAVEWHTRDRASLDRVQSFLAEPFIGRFGCGRARTAAEYEAYAGVSFRRQRTTDYTRRFLEPPNPPLPPDWADRIGRYEIEIGVEKAGLPADIDDYLFWYVGFHDAADQEVYRLDVDREEVRALMAAEGPTALIRRSFESERDPVSWTVWPYSESRTWLEKLQGPTLALDPDVTFVTALLDIGRDQLAPSFARSFAAHYLRLFVRLLQVDVPMIIHVPAEYEALVWRHRRPANTRVVPLAATELEALPWFGRVQAIRERGAWRDQASWLAESPQAQLPLYNPLVLSKMRWLHDAAAENPFESSHLFWIDAGLTHTVPEGLLTHRAIPAQLVHAAGDFLLAGFPYRESAEIHGFPRRDLARIAGVEDADVVMRGGFFGGRAEAIAGVAGDFAQLLDDTLEAGLLGTEESLFTILAHRQPDRFTCYALEADGLLGPLFEALAAGRAADRRFSLEPRRATPKPPPVPRVPLSLPPDVPDEARTGVSTYLDLTMMQNRYAIPAFRSLFQLLHDTGRPVARIVEIGTGPGGLSALLHTYCTAADADFLTYDRYQSVADNPALRALGIKPRVKDVEHPFVLAEIAREVQKEGLTILACDGPDKAAEVKALTPYLKAGDIVMAHDYARDRELFEQQIKSRLWSWCEITDADFAELDEAYDLEPLLEQAFAPAVWSCRLKRSSTMRVAPRQIPGDDVVGLYVLTFNAPAQFRSWIESVQRADPAILDGTDKVLLNNSTDESLFDEYDAICAEYGFAQHRLGNMGINAGRVWCSRHFFDRTNHAAMLYFEDDMLLHATPGVCRNGFSTCLPHLLSTSVDILRNEPGLDFLKLSFTELHGDHRENWAYYNLSGDERRRHFPEGHATRVGAIKSYAGVSYIVGEVFYSNWPMLMTRRGVQTMFLEAGDLVLYEQHLMVRALELSREGRLQGAVLLASPVNHDRQVHYPADLRREC